MGSREIGNVSVLGSTGSIGRQTLEVLRRNPDRTVLPGFIVDAVVEVPYGAHPTSFPPNYGFDGGLHIEWAKVSRDPDTTAQFVEQYITGPATHAEYLDTVGGVGKLAAMRNWEA